MRTKMQRWVLCGVVALLCAACGYKGPLYMPEVAPAPTAAPAPNTNSSINSVR